MKVFMLSLVMLIGVFFVGNVEGKSVIVIAFIDCDEVAIDVYYGAKV